MLHVELLPCSAEPLMMDVSIRSSHYVEILQSSDKGENH